MLGWIFKKKGNAPEAAAPTLAAQSLPPAVALPAPAADWTARFAQARGDDDALLALARTAGVPLQFKEAAVEALASEAALRLAEREFRSHDRRVYRVAKRRLLAEVARRQTREQAARLIDTARSLANETDMPVNRVVELERAWQALDASAIESAQRDAFAELTMQLASQASQRADTERLRKRWHANAVQALQRLQAASGEAASGAKDRDWLAAAISGARGVVEAMPAEAAPAPGADEVLAALLRALETGTALDLHLAVLDRLLAESTDSAPKADADLQQAWHALSPLPDTHLAALLQDRHARWQQARNRVQSERQSQERERARERQRAQKGEQVAAVLSDGVARAEAALDAGQLAEAQGHLSDIDDGLQGGDVPDALRARIAAAQARLAQLRGWQHWAGGRARDELVLQAEALAAATVGDGDGDGVAAGVTDAEVARLSIRQRAELIDSLRARWKELDGQGGGGRSLWQRFDAALKAAYAPVAAHQATQRAAREANLAARRQLLDILEAVGVAATGGLAEPAEHIPQPETKSEAPADAHALAAALDRFRVEWRKLGPLEHTVPRASMAALVERMESALRRVEAPLQSARLQARAERETLLARARALADDRPGRDLVGEVRALQAEWQQHARTLPLARVDEQALWTSFKGAIDAAFAAREASFRARESELEVHAAERAALIERLRASTEDSPAAQRRTLAEVDAAWQRCGPAPRARAAALEADFRASREALRQSLDASAQRAWQATCEALDAKLALCEAREQEAGEDPATLAATWQALPALPAALEEALRRRAGLAPARGAETVPSVDEWLLQIETAWDLPTPQAFESARRECKLLAMKAALEGRRASAPRALAPDAALALLLGCGGLDVEQRDRLRAVLAAWRRRGLHGPR